MNFTVSSSRMAPRGSKLPQEPRNASKGTKRRVGTKRGLKRKFAKKPKRGKLVKELDRVFSIYIRAKYPEKCFTCNKSYPREKLQCGHYVSRSVRCLRWHEYNCRPQCYGCNVMQNGKPIDFRINIVKELGEAIVKTLESERNLLCKYSDEELITQIAHYKQKIEEL